MSHFNKEYISYFEELKENNNRDWFQENKKRYEATVKEPFFNFISELIPALTEIEPDIQMTPKESIYRIYRDVRFSKDKIPYKTHNSAMVSAGGKKNKSYPGLYIETRADGISIYGGIYDADKNTLYAIRSFIAENLEDFKNAYSDSDFVSSYGKILGDKNKIIPKDFKPLLETEPLIANKQFYYKVDLPKKAITSKDLVEQIADKYRDCNKLRVFLQEAYNSSL